MGVNVGVVGCDISRATASYPQTLVTKATDATESMGEGELGGGSVAAGGEREA